MSTSRGSKWFSPETPPSRKSCASDCESPERAMARSGTARLHLAQDVTKGVAVHMRHAVEPIARDSPTDAGLLYERYSGRILAYCLYALRDRGEAEDAVQTTFLNAHRALAKGVAPEHEFAWLHMIAKNVCRVQRRTAARRAVVTGVDLDAFPACHDDSNGAEVLHDVGEALASIPEAQRRALVMREWHGLSSAEIASRMGISTPATYALLTRARRSLAHALSTAKGRSALGLNVWPSLARFKALFAGDGAAKIATTTALAVGVVAGGVTIEQALVDRPHAPPRADRSATDVERATFVPVRAVPASGATATAALTEGVRARVRAPTRGNDGTITAQAQPAALPTAPPRQVEPEAPAEPTVPVETTSVVDDTTAAALDAVPELPLPELDGELLDDIVPGEALPPLDDSVPIEPVQAPPLPELPPLP